MRAFIAVQLPAAFEDQVADVARQLGAVVQGRFLPRSTYHLTLAFLGDIDDAQRAGAMDAMDEACDGMAPLPFASDGLGKFGKPSDATLWLGVIADSRLAALAAHLREGLSRRGIPFDPKPFRPHITIARRARLPKGPLPALAFPAPAQAARITLFKSELGREGATYKPLYTVCLD